MLAVSVGLVDHSYQINSHRRQRCRLLSDPNPLLRIGSRRAARDFIAQVAGKPVDELLARMPSAKFKYSAYGQHTQAEHSVA
jgi:hypothetical protein